jgi:hypothetical protein
MARFWLGSANELLGFSTDILNHAEVQSIHLQHNQWLLSLAHRELLEQDFND